jgi:hypothetical protein
MLGAKTARDADLNEARAKLDEGLKACRAVMKDYRAMLSGNPVEGKPARTGGDAGSKSSSD